MVGSSGVSRLIVGSSGVSRLIGRSRVSHRLVSGSRGSMVDGSMVDRGVVDRSMVDRHMVNGSMSMVDRGMDGDMAGSMGSSDILLFIVVLVDLIGGGSGLSGHPGVVRAMGLVDGGSDGGGIAVFDALVAVLVGNSQSQESGESNESLHFVMVNASGLS